MNNEDEGKTIKPHTTLTAIALLVIAVIIGCQGSEQTFPVSGKITYEGQPVTSGLINFQPKQGRPLGGGVKPDGTYEFKIPAGEYQVRIDTPPAIPDSWEEGQPLPKPSKRQVPEKYARFGSSGLTITVADGPVEHDFVLP